MSKKPILLFGILVFLSGFFLHWIIYSYATPIAKEYTISQSIKDVQKACQEKRDKEDCYATAFGELTKKTSLKHAVATLAELQKTDEQARGCHFISHTIATAATEKDPSKWKEIIGKVSPDACSGGYLHGVIEAQYRHDKNFVLNETTIPDICSLTIKTNKDMRDGNCAHIMGHLLLVETGAHIDPAVTMCNKLPKEMHFECNSGVFMESETRENLVAHKLAKHIPWNEENIAAQEARCKSYTGMPATGCWRELSHMIVKQSPNDSDALYKTCKKSGIEDDIDECYQHGLSIISHSSGFEPAAFASFCKPLRGDLKKYWYCADRVIGSLIKSTPEFTPRAAEYCKTMPQSDLLRCYESISKHVAKYIAIGGRGRYCASIPKEYRNRCLSYQNKSPS